MLWLDMLRVPPSRVRTVSLAADEASVVLASRMSVLMLAVPPLMMKRPREGPAPAVALVRLARKNWLATLRTPVAPVFPGLAPPRVKVPVTPLAAEPLELTAI